MLEQWGKEPFAILGFIVSLCVLIVVLINFLKDKAKVIIEIQESKIRESGIESISGIYITIKNRGRRAITIRKIGILHKNGEKILQGGLDIPLHEHDYSGRAYDKSLFDDDLYRAIENHEYVVFAESDEGKRFLSCNRFSKFKKIRKF